MKEMIFLCVSLFLISCGSDTKPKIVDYCAVCSSNPSDYEACKTCEGMQAYRLGTRARIKAEDLLKQKNHIAAITILNEAMEKMHGKSSTTKVYNLREKIVDDWLVGRFHEDDFEFRRNEDEIRFINRSSIPLYSITARIHDQWYTLKGKEYMVEMLPAHQEIIIPKDKLFNEHYLSFKHVHPNNDWYTYIVWANVKIGEHIHSINLTLN